MCGLVALRAFTAVPQLTLLGAKALDTLAHRGPDDADWKVIGGESTLGRKACAPTFLGHRRLSILDLTEAGRQPMICPITGNALVFNGEIYNFIELRGELRAAGFDFRTDSDTEVILQAWRAWGEAAFARFNGMWAIVLLDNASGDLVCCRDRLGVKPLYYTRDNRCGGQMAIFASEIRAIASVLGAYPAPNRKAVFDFLVMGMSDHSCQTFYEGISAVPPGWIMRLTCNGSTHWNRYHHWPECNPQARLNPEHLHELISDSIRLRLRSDAPTVTLLSGGLDSSIITAMAERLAQSETRTSYAGAYTYGYRDTAAVKHDETAQARLFIAEIAPGTHHFIHLADSVPTEAELLELAHAQEEPIATPSILASYRIFRSIRDAGFKVVLGGEGADEVFGGYVKRYMSQLVRERLFSGNVSSALRMLRDGTANAHLVANQLVWQLPAYAMRSILRRCRPSVRVMNAGLWGEMTSNFSRIHEDRRANLEERLRLDVTATNLPMILRFADRNSMRFGVEVRSPYLDWRVVSAALAVPVAERMGDSHGKVALRRAFSNDLPERVVWRRKTHGFGNAEQFQVTNIRFDELWEGLPGWVGDLISLPQLRRELAQTANHSTLWWAVSVVLWLCSVYGDRGISASSDSHMALKSKEL
jgi:asparagine synthase (glutamine-hydrolysing)